MATFVSLIGWTEQGVRGFKDSVDRADAVANLAEKFGGKMKDTYWTLGQYDVVATFDFPDDESATAAMLAIGSQGNVRTTTLRAFGRDEMRGIIKKATTQA